MSFLNRAEETPVPSWPFALTITGALAPPTVAPFYTADKNLRGSTTYLRGTVVDADGLALIKRTAGGHSPADIHVIETVDYVKPGRPTTHDCVIKAAYVKLQCTVTDRYVSTAGIIIKQRIDTHGFVENTSGVTTERGIADGAV